MWSWITNPNSDTPKGTHPKLFHCNSPLFKRWASHLVNCHQEKERFDSTMVQRNFNLQTSQLFEISDELEVCILCLKYGFLEGNSAVKRFPARFVLIPSCIAVNQMRLTTVWWGVGKCLSKCRGRCLVWKNHCHSRRLYGALLAWYQQLSTFQYFQSQRFSLV